MRVFLTLCSLAAVALAKPQYNYGSGVSGTFGSGHTSGLGAGFSSFGSGSSGLNGNKAIKFNGGNAGYSSGASLGFGGAALHNGAHAHNGVASFGSGSHSGVPSFGSGHSNGVVSSFGSNSNGGVASFGSSSNGGVASFGSVANNGGSSFGGAAYNQGNAAHFEAPLVHKQFITVAAPEDNENLERSKHLVIGRPQKNYRVVFIKAPSSSNANVRLSAEYAPQEEKTVIYVLSKKDNQLEVGDIATPAPSVPSKPEVFFIKYKTEEEAQHAQRQIQAEYDKIEGSSEHTDVGVAPQQSVIGILGNGDAGLVSNTNSLKAGSSDSFHAGSSGSFVSSSSSSGSSNLGSTGSISNGNKSPAYLPPAGH